MVRISGSPSLYQIGLVRYIGGEMRYSREGLARQLSATASLMSWRVDWMRWDTEDGPSHEARKFVTHARMQTLEDSRTWVNDSTRFSKWPHEITWADLMEARALVLVLLTLLRTFESPRREKTRATDIVD